MLILKTNLGKRRKQGGETAERRKRRGGGNGWPAKLSTPQRNLEKPRVEAHTELAIFIFIFTRGVPEKSREDHTHTMPAIHLHMSLIAFLCMLSSTLAAVLLRGPSSRCN